MKRAPIIFFIIAALAAWIGFIQLGSHQKQTAKLVQSIVAVDKAGGNVSDKQRELIAYVRNHMRTSTSYMLEGSYGRAVSSAQAAAIPGGNGKVYADAQAACAGRADSVAQARCVQNFLAAHVVPAANPQSVALPAKSEYSVKLSAPGWTADSTGLAFLLALASALLSVYLLIVRRI
ncbi:MAG TPA: hypothetical protein VF272_00025 [Candidatus Saccharimonadia bacterium]